MSSKLGRWVVANVRLKLSLQWKILLLVAVSMSVILLVSSYLHTVRTRTLVERDHYENALSQLAVLGDRISRYDYFSSLEDLQQELQLVAGSRPDFKQIDIYETANDTPQLIATTSPGSPMLSSLETEQAKGGVETRPGVSSSKIAKNNSEFWLIRAEIGNAKHKGFIEALVLKSVHHQLVDNLHREYNLVMFGAVAAVVGLLYLVFNYFFRRPVKEVLQAMERTKGGGLSIRAKVHRDDELGAVANGFNGLMDDIAERSREREELLHQISDLNNGLLKRVEVATEELRAANLSLITTQQKLAASERMAAIGQVTASLAHEIGTPLNAINGHLQLLARKYSDIPDTQRRVRIIEAQLELIIQTVKSLLERTHRRKTTMAPIDVNQLVREVLLLVGPMLEMRNIKAIVTLDMTLPCAIADADSLHQVFLNLINNSCDAMPHGGSLELTTHLSEGAQMIEIVVKDTGTGVSSQIVNHLFEPMFTTKSSGSGLGLVIAREIIAEHRGHIELIPGSQSGAAFKLTLPVAEFLSGVQMEGVSSNAA